MVVPNLQQSCPREIVSFMHQKGGRCAALTDETARQEQLEGGVKRQGIDRTTLQGRKKAMKTSLRRRQGIGYECRHLIVMPHIAAADRIPGP